MSKKRRTFSAEFKAQVGLEALKGIEPVHAAARVSRKPTSARKTFRFGEDDALGERRHEEATAARVQSGEG